jgi:hypothetical protein
VLGELVSQLVAKDSFESRIVFDELGVEELAPGKPRSRTTALSMERPRTSRRTSRPDRLR